MQGPAFAVQELSFKFMDLTGSAEAQTVLALGDTNHNGRQEILIENMSLQRIEWDGSQYRLSDVADLGKTGFSSCYPEWCVGASSANSGMGVQPEIIVSDLDGDMANEILFGGEAYHFMSWGGFYAFDWDEDTLFGQYANYCLGRVYRLDMISFPSGTGLLVSTRGHETDEGNYRPAEGTSSQQTCASPFLQTGMVSWRGLFYLNPDDYSVRWGMSIAPLSSGEKDKLQSEWSYWEPILTVAQLTETREWYAVKRKPSESRLYVYRVNPEGYVEVDIPIEIPWNELQVEYLYQLEAGDLDGDGVNELVSSLRSADEEFHIVTYRWNGIAYEPWWDTEVFPMRNKRIGSRWDDYKIWLGDIEADRDAEILTEDGDIYQWNGERFVLWNGLREVLATPEKLSSGALRIIDMVTENVDDDEQNEVIILIREMPYNFVYIAQVAQ